MVKVMQTGKELHHHYILITALGAAHGYVASHYPECGEVMPLLRCTELTFHY